MGRMILRSVHIRSIHALCKFRQPNTEQQFLLRRLLCPLCKVKYTRSKCPAWASEGGFFQQRTNGVSDRKISDEMCRPIMQ